MYRDPQASFADRVERLEKELAELRALRAPARPRERTLWSVTGASVVAALLACSALASTSVRAVDLQRQLEETRSRLDVKSELVGECERVAEDAVNAQRQCAAALGR
jgi:hypothetical protein